MKGKKYSEAAMTVTREEALGKVVKKQELKNELSLASTCDCCSSHASPSLKGNYQHMMRQAIRLGQTSPPRLMWETT